MKPTLTAGVAGTREFLVDRERTIDFMGEDARVYATPMLVRDIEVTCREMLLPHLDSGEDSVGTRVEIDHLAATLMGMKATISATIADHARSREPMEQELGDRVRASAHFKEGVAAFHEKRRPNYG